MCALTARNFQSLDFTVNRVLMKLFKTSNTEIINGCRNFFGSYRVYNWSNVLINLYVIDKFVMLSLVYWHVCTL